MDMHYAPHRLGDISVIIPSTMPASILDPQSSYLVISLPLVTMSMDYACSRSHDGAMVRVNQLPTCTDSIKRLNWIEFIVNFLCVCLINQSLPTSEFAWHSRQPHRLSAKRAVMASPLLWKIKTLLRWSIYWIWQNRWSSNGVNTEGFSGRNEMLSRFMGSIHDVDLDL